MIYQIGFDVDKFFLKVELCIKKKTSWVKIYYCKNP